MTTTMVLETAGSWWLTIAARYIHLQEEYIKDEQRSLKRELVRAQEEIKRIQSVPLVIGQFMEAIDQK
jgi:26S proteasome regulatory subunit T3